MIVCTTLAIVLCLYSVKQIIHRGECKKLSTNPTSVKSTHNGTKQITGFVLGNLVSQGTSDFFRQNKENSQNIFMLYH